MKLGSIVANAFGNLGEAILTAFDFFLGDMVQIVNEYGIEGKARVTEFIRSQSKEGLDSYPTFVTVE